MCLSFICDFWLLNIIILNSSELKCTQNIKLYHFVQTILSVYQFCPYHFVGTIWSATIFSGHRLKQLCIEAGTRGTPLTTFFHGEGEAFHTYLESTQNYNNFQFTTIIIAFWYKQQFKNKAKSTQKLTARFERTHGRIRGRFTGSNLPKMNVL